MPQGYYLWGKNKLGGALVVYKVCSTMQLLLEHLHQHVPKTPAMGKPICWGLLLWKHNSSGDENSIFTRGFNSKNHKHPLLLVIIEAHKQLQAMEKNLNCRQPQQCFKNRNHKHIRIKAMYDFISLDVQALLGSQNVPPNLLLRISLILLCLSCNACKVKPFFEVCYICSHQTMIPDFGLADFQ